jgi:ubiquitin-conjugating enzyme E2 S
LPISSLHYGNYFISLVIGAAFDLHQSIPYAAMRRLLRELKELRTSPPEGIRVQLSEESVLDVVGIIEGPGASCEYPEQSYLDRRVFAEGTPYQGGYFRVKFEFTEEFPAAPPKCTIALPRIQRPLVLISY